MTGIAENASARPLWHGIDLARIERALRQAEAQTSAEIRVAVSRWYFWGDVRGAAARAFERLGIARTHRRNGVLLFLALRRRQFALLGDAAAEERMCGQGWERAATTLRDRLRQVDLSEAIEATIGVLGAELAVHFPRTADDRNELSDAVVTDA